MKPAPLLRAIFIGVHYKSENSVVLVQNLLQKKNLQQISAKTNKVAPAVLIFVIVEHYNCFESAQSSTLLIWDQELNTHAL